MSACHVCRSRTAPAPEGRYPQLFKRNILDSLGCAIAALPGQPFQALREQFEEYRAPGRCTLIGGGRTSADQAALFNSGLVRYVDLLVLECGGNSGSEWAAQTAPDVQRSHGLVSCSEWTGVPLSLLLAEAGVRPGAAWVIAEGADACRMERSIPMAKAMNDILLAYGQNGEALRPAQGYPLRLIIPGWEGNANVKWVHRLQVTDQAFMARDETAKYTDLMPDGKARLFTYQMEAKSVITFPSGGQRLSGPGLYELTGLAWSGRGRVERVEITTDGGRSWVKAQLQEPRLPIAFTRFRLPWRFEGREAVIASRSVDESGYVQPTREALIEVRGTNSAYHYNGIKLWKVHADGTVTNVEV